MKLVKGKVFCEFTIKVPSTRYCIEDLKLWIQSVDNSNDFLSIQSTSCAFVYLQTIEVDSITYSKSLTEPALVCMCSWEFGFHRRSPFRTSAARLMVGSRRRNKFHSSLMHCSSTLDAALGSFGPANPFDLLPHSNSSSRAFACRSVDSSPACNF